MEEERRIIKEEIKNGISLVNFSATWCGPCKVMSPVIEKLKSEDNGFNIIKLDVEQYTEEGTEYGVRSIPTFIVFKDGIEQERWTGTKSKNDISDILNKY